MFGFRFGCKFSEISVARLQLCVTSTNLIWKIRSMAANYAEISFNQVSANEISSKRKPNQNYAFFHHKIFTGKPNIMLYTSFRAFMNAWCIIQQSVLNIIEANAVTRTNQAIK